MVLWAIAEGVRAGGRLADENWSNQGQDMPNVEDAIEEVIRNTIESTLGAAKIKVAWLKGEHKQLHQGLSQGEIVLIADAIDGYRMFKRQIPNWCIAVGAGRWENGALEPIAGVIFHPPTQEMFIGLVGGGAVLINERLAEFRQLPPMNAGAKRKAVIATHFSVEKPELSLQLLKNLLCEVALSKDQVERAVMLGSGQLALAYVAAQRFQVFANVTTHYWNAFAGVAIVQAACGDEMVSDTAGEPWNIGSEGIVAWSGTEARSTLGAMLSRALRLEATAV
jgi:fructose-1,6-bisphosphatase/inositol monophosphatase family enzyme